MKKLGYYLEASGECVRTIDKLINAIPCFVRKYTVGKVIELELEVRAEDAVTVENRLAAFV